MWKGLFSRVSAYVQQHTDSIMGNHYSSFVRALRDGDAAAALDLYTKKKAVREAIKPNEPTGDPEDNTIMHHLARLNISTVYQELLGMRVGLPDMKNRDRQNCLHLLCAQSGSEEIKHIMLKTTLDIGLQGMDIKHVLSEKDLNGNTVLHLAASSGLSKCVFLLIERGAQLSAVNESKETPADLATRAGHTSLATQLETKIVFEGDDSTVVCEGCDEETAEFGLKDHELRSMKDELLVETANMLGVSLLTAQALLRDHDWSKEALLEAWMDDAALVCEGSGVDLPQELGTHQLDTECLGGARSDSVRECEVCYLATPFDVLVPCDHHFCTPCWKQYLEEKIACGESQRLTCLQYGCYTLVPLGVIERIVSPEMARKFLSFDIKAFVDSNPNIRWCPRPGCGQAVTLATESTVINPNPEVTVHCRNNHYFCWACLRVAHAPVLCEVWTKWLDHIEEMRPRVGDTSAAEADEAASNKWLADRSKPCPKCRSPIEKTEGCNHMCCKKCKHDFCWVCLDNWKCHNSTTGGYFECNRYDAQKKATALLDERRDSYYGNAKELEAISRFLHYFERYKEHLNSLALEEPYLDKAKDKMSVLAGSVRGLEVCDDMRFIEEAVRELLHCRRVLAASYPHAYYLPSRVRRRFEGVQGSLEVVTELLAEVVARPHLRKPRSDIIRLTHEARTKRGIVLESYPLPSTQYTPPTHHIRDSSDSDGGEDTDVTTFLCMLEAATGRGTLGRSHDRSHDQSREDDELLRVLELSRQEFEADKQLAEDIEKAKAQSSTEPPILVPLTFEPQATPTTNWLDMDDDYDQLSWPVLTLPTPPTPPHYTHSTPPHSTDANWGPVLNEDEDLDVAIAMSLQQQDSDGRDMMSIVGDQVVDSNKIAESEAVWSLPPELQHLLQTTQRTGEHV